MEQDLERGLELAHTLSKGVTIFGSARVKETDTVYQQARKLAGVLADHGHTIVTGGGPGVMEAANRGAYEHHGRSIGFNIILPSEQKLNPYLTDSVEMHYFFARKVMLTIGSKAFVFFPGGYGTMDELSELLILAREHKMPVAPIYLIGREFWGALDRFYDDYMEKTQLIGPQDRQLYTIVDNIETIVQGIDQLQEEKIDVEMVKKNLKKIIKGRHSEV